MLGRGILGAMPLPSAAIDGPSEENDALVRSFIAAWERRDTEPIVECFAEQGVYHATPLAPIVGREAIREFVAAFEHVPPGRFKILHQVASDKVVMHERVDRITFDGRPIVLPIIGVFEIADAHITAWREYFDLGVFSKPP